MVAEIRLSPSSSRRTRDPGVAGASLARDTARHDATLVSRFNAGDDPAFDEIIARYQNKISAFAFTVLRNHADAEEIAQDTMIRAHRGLAAFRGHCSLATWLHTIALNLARNRYWYYFRRRRQFTQSLDCAISEDNPATFSDLAACESPGPVQEATTREFSAVVAACISKLSTGHREILEQRILQGHSYDEIAVTLDISVGTVKSRIARAREKLREALAISYPEFATDAAPYGWIDSNRPAGWMQQVG